MIAAVWVVVCVVVDVDAAAVVVAEDWIVAVAVTYASKRKKRWRKTWKNVAKSDQKMIKTWIKYIKSS